jgi:aspartate racemase
MMKTIGILGGLGPLAGAFFYRRLIELTPVLRDEDHLPVVMISSPSIPSRIAHLEGRGPSPVPALQSAARILANAGAELIVMPSSTTHAYYGELTADSAVSWINMIEVVSSAVAAYGIKRLGLLATTPTITYHLYDEALAAYGITPVNPDARSQSEIMDVISGVKSGGAVSPLGRRLLEIAERPWSDEAQGILLACTETPVAFPSAVWNQHHQRPVLSATDIIAAAAIEQGRADSHPY